MLEPLRHFALVSQHGTFTAAARHAHVTQPALTASIQRLEAQMGARLFDRGPGGATLTAAGAALLPRARAALAALEEGRRAVAEVMGLAAGSVRIGAGATVCTYYLPRTLARFRAQHPAVQILLREATPDDLIDALEAGDLDLVILARIAPPARRPAPRTGKRPERRDAARRLPPDLLRVARSGLAREKWLDDELVLVAAPGLPNAAEAPLVTFAHGATTRTLTDQYFPDRPIAMELGSIAAVKANARAGVGVALVSRRAVDRDIAVKQLEIVASERTPIARPLYLVHRGRDRLPPAASELRGLLKQRAPSVGRDDDPR
ncbi:MAG: LysR family transcriptional regulator [Labilithrix sp.]|nr:LysR family transcriptional regulator [Labilithrix sp.]MBX3223316.1 LysR family transcriptional regulator [Labilithrix sp.]